MLTGKQKRYLRSQANTLRAIVHIGKEGLGPKVVGQIKEDLESRELVKGSVLQSCPVKTKEAAAQAAELTGSEVVQTIGRKFVIYKRSEKKPVIKLPE
jgi:RNA-binding protein